MATTPDKGSVPNVSNHSWPLGLSTPPLTEPKNVPVVVMPVPVVVVVVPVVVVPVVVSVPVLVPVVVVVVEPVPPVSMPPGIDPPIPYGSPSSMARSSSVSVCEVVFTPNETSATLNRPPAQFDDVESFAS